MLSPQSVDKGTSASSAPVWQAQSLARPALPGICTFLGSLILYFSNKQKGEQKYSPLVI